MRINHGGFHLIFLKLGDTPDRALPGMIKSGALPLSVPLALGPFFIYDPCPSKSIFKSSPDCRYEADPRLPILLRRIVSVPPPVCASLICGSSFRRWKYKRPTNGTFQRSHRWEVLKAQSLLFLVIQYYPSES